MSLHNKTILTKLLAALENREFTTARECFRDLDTNFKDRFTTLVNDEVADREVYSLTGEAVLAELWATPTLPTPIVDFVAENLLQQVRVLLDDIECAYDEDDDLFEDDDEDDEEDEWDEDDLDDDEDDDEYEWDEDEEDDD